MMRLIALTQTIWKRYRIVFEHLPAALTIAVTGYLLTDDTRHILVALFFGWLIDIDHIFDYLLFAKRTSTPLSFGNFMSGAYFKDGGKVILPLHSFEICGAMALLTVMVDFPNHQWLITGTLAMGTHLIQDQFSHKPTRLGYFLLARFFNGFRTEWFCHLN